MMKTVVAMIMAVIPVFDDDDYDDDDDKNTGGNDDGVNYEQILSVDGGAVNDVWIADDCDDPDVMIRVTMIMTMLMVVMMMMYWWLRWRKTCDGVGFVTRVLWNCAGRCTHYLHVFITH